MMRRTLVSTGLFLAAATAWGIAQQATPPAAPPAQSGQATTQPRLTFRGESNYVEVDTVVTDGKGNIIRDLTRDDFTVLEDGQPQKVDAFSFIDIPLERADKPLYRPTTVEPDVSDNMKAFDGRVYLIVLDAYHIEPQLTAQVRQLVKQFIGRNIGANDLAAVVQIGNPRASQEFTASRLALDHAVDTFIGQRLQSSALNTLSDRIAKTNSDGKFNLLSVGDPEEPARAAQAREALSSIERLSQYMAGMRGRRKAVLFFSEGIDFNTDDVIGADPRSDLDAAKTRPEAADAATVLDAERDMMSAAARANVSIYSIDPRGVASADNEMIGVTGTPTPGTSDPPPTMDVQEEIRRSQASLRTFSEQTGGLAFVNSSNFTSAFDRIVQDNSAYYLLGYYAPAVKHDGKFHNLSVKVARPGVQVRSRKGYFAPKDTAAPATAAPAPDVLHELLSSPLPISGLPLRVAAQVLKGTGANAHVCLTVEVEGKDLPFQDKNGNFANSVEFSYAAYDTGSAPLASGKKTMNLSLTPENRQAVLDRGLRLTTEFDLPPGRYQLRLAGHESLGDRSGSVFRDLVVPDFATAPLMLSDPLLTSSAASTWPTSADATSLKDLLPGPVTAVRDFALDESLAVFTAVYDNNLEHPHTIDLSAAVRAEDGTQVFVVRDERDTKELGASGGTFGYLARIPLLDLVPGRYILSITAQSRLGGAPAVKEISFRVH